MAGLHQNQRDFRQFGQNFRALFSLIAGFQVVPLLRFAALRDQARQVYAQTSR